jgi:hypothetical protein
MPKKTGPHKGAGANGKGPAKDVEKPPEEKAGKDYLQCRLGRTDGVRLSDLATAESKTVAEVFNEYYGADLKERWLKSQRERLARAENGEE